MAKETNEEARLRLFLAEYERVCKRYNLVVYREGVYERNCCDNDNLPPHMTRLKRNGINGKETKNNKTTG